MNANDLLRHYNCSENYYKAGFGFIYTDGVNAFCSEFECYWFLNVILSYQSKMRQEDFQVWKLERNENGSAKVICSNGNGKQLISQKIPFTDFKPNEGTVWIENNVIFLPSEH